MGTLIGKGVIANRFADYSLQNEYLVFAGTINDSSISNEVEFENELSALQEAIRNNTDKTVLFFSSCSINDPDMANTSYVRHKLKMESFVQKNAHKYFIFRLPQILALSDATSSLVNYLVDNVLNQRPFEVWQNAMRNLIDIDDVHEIIGEFLKRSNITNQIVNIASSQQTSIFDLVKIIEKFFGTTANYKTVAKGSSYKIDISYIDTILNDLNITFGTNYLERSINKYYSHLKQLPKLISVVVPTYNEEHGIEEFYRRTKNVLTLLHPRFNYEIIFINDYSTDKTLNKIQNLSKNDINVKVINFSRNFGNQIGITAGIDHAKGDIAIVIDDDLQDPPEIILNLIAQWDKGYKVVYGVRPKRLGGSILFKLTAKLYYRVISGLSDTKIPNDTGDFRLIDRVVIETLKKIKEENRYYRGLVAWVGYPQIGVLYERDRRYAGVSTFSFKKYVNFALNGLTSFTEKPLYFSSIAGFFITLISFVLALILVINKILDPSVSIRGWTSLTVIMLFFGGLQLLSIGILGVYVSKIYREVKGRPLYIVESTENLQKGENPLL